MMRKFGLAVALILALVCSDTWGQSRPLPPKRADIIEPADSSKPRSTIIELRLFANTDGGGLHSQQWSKLLETMDVSIQIQRPTVNDKPEVRERMVGFTRYVTAVGTLDRGGRISFPGHTFELSDGTKLREWIDELKTYGAQGTPNGQPNWGLSKDQFNLLYSSLLKPAEAETIDLPIAEAVTKLPLPAKFPIKFSQAATAQLRLLGSKATVRQDVRGFTAATALAVMLNDCSLGFRPNRTPADGLELLVEPQEQRKDLWPVGWPLQKQRMKAAPKLFAMTPIELDQVPLTDLLATVAELTETPVLLDYYEIEKAKIDLSKIDVSFKRASTSWSVALKTMVIPKKLSREIWQDEAGRAFVWVTTNRPGRAVVE